MDATPQPAVLRTGVLRHPVMAIVLVAPFLGEVLSTVAAADLPAAAVEPSRS
jgi:hypothetical protein